MKKIIFLFLITNCVIAQQNFSYYLPQKVIVVEVPVTKITKTPGDCYGFDVEILKKNGIDTLPDWILDKDNPKYGKCEDDADRIGKLKVNIEKKGEDFNKSFGFYASTYNIKDSDIAIKSKPVKDPLKKFDVNLDKKLMKKIGFAVSLNQVSLPTVIESTFENKTFEIITTGLVTFAKVALGVKATSADKKSCDCLIKKEKLQKFYKTKEELLTNPSGLMTEGTLKTYIEKIDNEIENLESVFSFSMKKESAIIYREFLFNVQNLKNEQDIFSIDKAKIKITFHKKSDVDYVSNPDLLPLGIVTDSNLLGDKYTITLNRYNSEPDIKNDYTVPIIPNNIYFNVPSAYRVILNKGKDKIKETEELMPQFGSVGSIPYNLNKTKIEYDENGSIRSLAIESDAILSADNVSKLGDTVDALKPKTAKTASEKQVEGLEQDKKIITLQKEILEAKKNIKLFEKELNVKEN